MSVRPPEFQAPVEGMPSETLLSGAAMAASIHAGAGWDTQPKNLAPAAASWLDKLPGGVFQLHRDVDGRWTDESDDVDDDDDGGDDDDVYDDGHDDHDDDADDADIDGGDDDANDDW